MLLVEDDPEVATLTAEMLRGLGLAVAHAGTAEQALRTLAERRDIDIVFSDVMMPGGMSGIELAREVRRRRPDLPIVLTTGFEMSAAQARDEEITLLAQALRDGGAGGDLREGAGWGYLARGVRCLPAEADQGHQQVAIVRMPDQGFLQDRHRLVAAADECSATAYT